MKLYLHLSWHYFWRLFIIYIPGGSPLLHHSWFFGVLKRAFMHESKQLVKWSLQYCLQLDLGKLDLPSDEIFDFIIQTVLETLKQSFLYHKEDNIEIGGAPSILKYLKLFFKNRFHELDGERQKVLFKMVMIFFSFVCQLKYGLRNLCFPFWNFLFCVNWEYSECYL